MNETSEKTLENFKEEKKEKFLGEATPNEDEKELAKKIFEEARMPLELKDDDVKCGEGEIDIRNLSKANRDQMIYRVLMLNLVYLRQLCQNQTDSFRLQAAGLRALGVKNITSAIEEAIAQMAKELDEGKVA